MKLTYTPMKWMFFSPEESHLRYKNKPERCEVNQLPCPEYLLSVITHVVCCLTFYLKKKILRIQYCIPQSLLLTVGVERFIDVINDKLVAYVRCMHFRLWTWTKHCFSGTDDRSSSVVSHLSSLLTLAVTHFKIFHLLSGLLHGAANVKASELSTIYT